MIMKQINPDYLALLVDYESRKSGLIALLDGEQSQVKKEMLQFQIDAIQKLIDETDAQIHEWEKLYPTEKIDHFTGEVTGETPPDDPPMTAIIDDPFGTGV